MSSRKRRQNRKEQVVWSLVEKESPSLVSLLRKKSPSLVSLQWKTQRSDPGDFRPLQGRSESFEFAGSHWGLVIQWEEAGACTVSLELSRAFPENLTFGAKTTVSKVGGRHMSPSVQFVQVRESPRVIFRKAGVALERFPQIDEVWTVNCVLSCGRLDPGKTPVTFLRDSSGSRTNYLYADRVRLFSPCHLGDSFRQLSADPTKRVAPDVQLRCADGTVMSAHRAILTFRSEAFADTFRNKMAEGGTTMVDVPDLDAKTLRLLLGYLYSGKIPDESVRTARSLYVAATQYGVRELEKTCSRRMISKLSRDNCLDFLSLARDRNLEQAAVELVAWYSDILDTDDWSKFESENPALAEKVRKIVRSKELFPHFGLAQTSDLETENRTLSEYENTFLSEKVHESMSGRNLRESTTNFLVGQPDVLETDDWTKFEDKNLIMAEEMHSMSYRNLRESTTNFLVGQPDVLETEDWTKFKDENPTMDEKMLETERTQNLKESATNFFVGQPDVLETEDWIKFEDENLTMAEKIRETERRQNLKKSATNCFDGKSDILEIEDLTKFRDHKLTLFEEAACKALDDLNLD